MSQKLTSEVGVLDRQGAKRSEDNILGHVEVEGVVCCGDEEPVGIEGMTFRCFLKPISISLPLPYRVLATKQLWALEASPLDFEARWSQGDRWPASWGLQQTGFCHTPGLCCSRFATLGTCHGCAPISRWPCFNFD